MIKNPDTYIEIDNDQALSAVVKTNVPFPICTPEPDTPVPPPPNFDPGLFIFEVDTGIDEGATGFNVMEIPLFSGESYDATIDWGDGTFENITSDTTLTHDYGVAGRFRVIIDATGTGGTCAGCRFGSSNDRKKLVDILQWGTSVEWVSGDSTFSQCTNLTFVSANDGPNLTVATSLYRMFFTCNKVTRLNVTNWDVSTITDLSAMFRAMTIVTTLDVSDWDISNATDVSQMFFGCNNLAGLDIGNWDTGNVTDFSQIFDSCKLVPTLAVENWDMTSAVNISEMFEGCSIITSLDLSLWSTPNLVDMGGTFLSCSGLTSLDLSGIDSSSVTDMGSLFESCKLLTTIDLSPLDTSNVSNMSDMFYNCTGLISIDLTPLNTISATTMTRMFQGCTSLTTLDLTPLETDNVTNFTSMFRDCSALNSIDFTGFNTSSAETFEFMFRSCSGLVSLDLSSFITPNLTTTREMFSSCRALSSLDTSNLITTSVTDMKSMFQGCEGFSSLDLSHFDTSSVSLFNTMFERCYNITSLNLTGWNTSSAVNMLRMFSNLRSIVSLDVSSFDNQNVTTMEGMFEDCFVLSTIDVSAFNTGNVTSMKNMFTECFALDVDVSTFDVSSLTAANNFLRSTLFSTVNYDKLLDPVTGWPSQTLISNVNVHFGNATFSAGAPTTGRDTLIDPPNNWVITDGGAFVPVGFRMTVDTNLAGASASNQFTLPLFPGETYNFTLNDGDGNITSHTTDADVTITYTVPGTYEIEVLGTFPRVYFNGAGDATKVIDIDAFGADAGPDSIQWSSMAHAFRGCSNAIITALDQPDLSGVTSLESMFEGCLSLSGTPPFDAWNVSTITVAKNFLKGAGFVTLTASDFFSNTLVDAEGVFAEMPNLTSIDISGWSLPNVTTFKDLFRNCTALTTITLPTNAKPSLTTIEGMFFGCTALVSMNEHQLDTSAVTTMIDTFGNCSSFNPDVDNWDIEQLLDADRMFNGSGLSTSNYDNLLIQWRLQLVQPNVKLGAANTYYTPSVQLARDQLTNAPNNWIIDDLGQTQFLITGTISGFDKENIQVNLGGAGADSTLTDAAGFYSFNALNGNYTVTPVPGVTREITPTSLNVTVNNGDNTGNNFTSVSSALTFDGENLTFDGEPLSFV